MKLRIVLMPAMLASAVAIAAAHSQKANALLQGRFDNGAQVARTAGDPAHATPHVTVTIEPTPKQDWSLWHVHIQTDPESTFDQTWAMQARSEYDGSNALIPYYQFKQESDPAAATFDAKDWLSLEACALRGKASATRMEGFAEGEPCVAVSMSVGARRALLPVGFVREGDSLELDMNLRGVRTRIEALRSP
jgi:hypothetical protein